MRSKNKRKRITFVAFCILVSLFALIFIVKNFREQIVFFYSPSELSEALKVKDLKDRQIRVGGLVVEGSVDKKDGLLVEFEITDGLQNLKIIHRGLTPDLFREKQGVVAKGVYDKNAQVFKSFEMLVKHDEKYMPPEVAKSIKHELR